MSGTAEADAVKLVTEFEGFVGHPYQDAGGTWTIGYGSTRDANGAPVTGRTPPISVEDAKELVERDLRAAFATVKADVRTPITAEQDAALADFVYNLGARNFGASTLLKKLNAGDYEGCANEFEKWDHCGGKVLAGLLRRRKSEEKLFDTPPPEAPRAPAAPTPHDPVAPPVSTPVERKAPLALIRFSPGVGLAGAIVRYATWSWCAHVGFKLADGHVLDAAPDTGVSIHTVVDDPGTQYYRVDCPDAVLAEALHWATTQIGKPYDWTAIYGMALHRDWHNDSAWFCSEFVEGAFDAAGYPLVVDNGRVDRISPRDLLLSPRLIRVR
jgi:lysozyme